MQTVVINLVDEPAIIPDDRSLRELGQMIFPGVTITLMVAGEADKKLLALVAQRYKKLTGLSYRNKHTYLQESMYVDYATLRAIAIQYYGHVSFNGSILYITLKPTENVKLTIYGPTIHHNTDLIRKP